jgi:hypothetical protein
MSEPDPRTGGTGGTGGTVGTVGDSRVSASSRRGERPSVEIVRATIA